MIKKVLIATVVALIVAFVVFYHWAKAPTLGFDYYDKLEHYQEEPLFVPDTLKVMTYNMGYLSGMTNNMGVDRSEDFFQNNLDKVVDVLIELEPDILGLQEIDFSSYRSFYQNQMDTIALKVGYINGFRSVNWDKRYVPYPYWPPKNHFKNIISGQAILADYPLFNIQRMVLPQPDKSFVYKAFNISRLLQMSDIHIGDQRFRLMNVHLEAFDKETRLEHAKWVKMMFERHAKRVPVILMGDFNSQPVGEEQSEAMEIIMSAEHIKSVVPVDYYNQDPEPYYTFSSADRQYAIDHILYNENFLKAVSAEVVTEMGQASDHLPLMAKFVQIRKNP